MRNQYNGRDDPVNIHHLEQEVEERVFEVEEEYLTGEEYLELGRAIYQHTDRYPDSE